MPFRRTDTTHHSICLGGRHLTSRATQQVCGRAKSVCPQSSHSSPHAKFTWHLNDHVEALLGSPRGRETVLKAPPVAGQPLTLDHWRTLGEGSALMDPLVPSGGGQEAQQRQEGRVNRTGIYF